MSEEIAGPTREPIPRNRLIVATLVAFGSGFLLALNVHLAIEGPITVVLFALWLLGPVVAGAILRTTRFWPYLIIGVAWFVTTPVSSFLGLLTVGDAVKDPSGPAFITSFTLMAVPFVTPLVAAVAYGAGLGADAWHQHRTA